MTNRQDWHVCELSQAGISSRAYTPGPYSNREDLLYAFDRMIVELHGDGSSLKPELRLLRGAKAHESQPIDSLDGRSFSSG